MDDFLRKCAFSRCFSSWSKVAWCLRCLWRVGLWDAKRWNVVPFGWPSCRYAAGTVMSPHQSQLGFCRTTEVSKDFIPTESTYSAAMSCCRGEQQWEIALHLNEATKQWGSGGSPSFKESSWCYDSVEGILWYSVSFKLEQASSGSCFRDFWKALQLTEGSCREKWKTNGLKDDGKSHGPWNVNLTKSWMELLLSTRHFERRCLQQIGQQCRTCWIAVFVAIFSLGLAWFKLWRCLKQRQPLFRHHQALLMFTFVTWPLEDSAPSPKIWHQGDMLQFWQCEPMVGWDLDVSRWSLHITEK